MERKGDQTNSMERNEKKPERQTIEEELAQASLNIQEEGQEEKPAVEPALHESAGRVPRSRRGKPSRRGRTAAFCAAGILVAAAGFYCGMALRYREAYFPNTVINGISAGGMKADQVKAEISSALDGYQLRLAERDGQEENIFGEEVGLHTVFNGQLEALLEEQNPLLWGLSWFQDKQSSVDAAVAWDQDALQRKIQELSALDPDKIRPYQAARLSDYISGQGYEVIPEDPGTEVNEEVLFEAVEAALLSLQDQLSLEEAGCYVHPLGQETDPALTEAAETMNRYVGTKVTYTFGSRQEVLDGETTHQWIFMDGSGQPALDETQVSQYVSDLAEKYNTSYTTREFMTSYGKTVKVAGVYGWRINQSAETAALTQIIRDGESQTREPEYSLKAASHDGNDYGNTYAEVNLTAQHMFFYKDGKKILESDFVSGNVSKGYTTPPGLFSLTYKQRDAVLRGEGYASPVNFWMPFNGGIGFHDASWRNQFGGSIYKTNGSHGCINMPYEAAKTLYENVYAGMPVICYNLEGTESKGSTSASGAKPEPTTAAPPETTPAATLPPETTPAATAPPETTSAAAAPPETTPAATLPAETAPSVPAPPESAPAATAPSGPSVPETSQPAGPGGQGETEYGPGMEMNSPGPGGMFSAGPGA